MLNNPSCGGCKQENDHGFIGHDDDDDDLISCLVKLRNEKGKRKSEFSLALF